MKRTKVYLLASLTIAQTSCAALAHYEEKGDAHKVVPKQQAKTTDPWKLLEMAISPAYASSSGVTLTVEGPYRVMRATGLPDHPTGAFPNRGNPNHMSEQDYVFRIPVQGQQTGYTTPLQMRISFGVALNGIPFDPGANEFWNGDRSSGWQYEAMALGPRLGLDENNAHVQPSGAYHYHGLPIGLLRELSSSGRQTLIGYAADGFPIYSENKRSSYRLKSGTRPSGPGGSYDGTFVADYEYVPGLGDLDDCNGRSGATPEYPNGTYYYVVSETFPFIPRGFKGTPDPSFDKHPRGRGGGPPGFPPPFPPPFGPR